MLTCLHCCTGTRPHSRFGTLAMGIGYIALHCTALHCTALHCTALHCIALHCTALHCTALHCTPLHCIILHCTVCTAQHYITLRCLHCSALHCTAHSTIYCTAPVLQFAQPIKYGNYEQHSNFLIKHNIGHFHWPGEPKKFLNNICQYFWPGDWPGDWQIGRLADWQICRYCSAQLNIDLSQSWDWVWPKIGMGYFCWFRCLSFSAT